MKRFQLINSKLTHDTFKVKFDLWTLVLAAVRLAGRYGKIALPGLLAVAYVAACFKAFVVTNIAIALMLPILLLAALYIAVSEEVNR